MNLRGTGGLESSSTSLVKIDLSMSHTNMTADCENLTLGKGSPIPIARVFFETTKKRPSLAIFG